MESINEENNLHGEHNQQDGQEQEGKPGPENQARSEDEIYRELSRGDPLRYFDTSLADSGLYPYTNPQLYPLNLQLKKVPGYIKLYNALLPISHIMKLSMKYGRFHRSGHQEVRRKDWLARGTYKNVYRVPENRVIKISRNIRLSDPICGSVYRDVDRNRSKYLMLDEIESLEKLEDSVSPWFRNQIRLMYNRLGMERYFYEKVHSSLGDLAVQTKYFMGIEYRKVPGTMLEARAITPMDVQPLLPGKHLKEFAYTEKQPWWEMINPNEFMNLFDSNSSYGFQFENTGKIKKKIIKRITEDFRRLIKYTERLAREEKLILDIHSENIIITLPDFSVRVFDFHMFDEHLYEPENAKARPGQQHIEMIEHFIDTLQASRRKNR